MDEEILWEIIYDDAPEAQSYAFIGDAYDWTDQITPGEANQANSTKTENTNGDLSEDIEITEVYPNPEGADQDKEWIEITNGGDEPVNLGNWEIDDGEGGSDPYVFPDETIIGPGETIIIKRQESKVALNNSNETVQLSDYSGENMDEISYEQSVEGKSYAKINIEQIVSLQVSNSVVGNRIIETWQWVSPTPGEINPIWKQFTGEITNIEGGIITLFDGINHWELITNENELNTLIYKLGNRVLIQALAEETPYTIMNSELLLSKPVENTKEWPWSSIITGALVSSWIGYEAYKKHNKTSAFSHLTG